LRTLFALILSSTINRCFASEGDTLGSSCLWTSLLPGLSSDRAAAVVWLGLLPPFLLTAPPRVSGFGGFFCSNLNCSIPALYVRSRSLLFLLFSKSLCLPTYRFSPICPFSLPPGCLSCCFSYLASFEWTPLLSSGFLEKMSAPSHS